MTLMIGLHNFFLEMSKECWPRFRVRNSTLSYPPTLLQNWVEYFHEDKS
jgi:hypothetical protein